MAHRTRFGNWSVRWRDKAQGVMRSRNFTRKFDADRFEAELKLGMRFNQEAVNYTTFAEFSQRWLRQYSDVHKAESTRQSDRQIIRDYLLPTLGESKLRELTKKDLISLQASLVSARKLSPKTINNITGQARKMMQDAYDWEMIPGNPWAKVKSLTIQDQPFDFWSFDEADRFLTYCRSRSPGIWQFVTFALQTGLRKGEIEGLFRDSVDFEQKVVVVRRSYNHRTPTKIQEQTKSKRIRRVELNTEALAVLSDRRLLAPNQRLFKHLCLKDFKRVCKAAGVKVITIHDLRHTFASHMVMKGCNLVRLQQLLGHREMKTTMRYAHLSPGYFTGDTEVLVRSAVRRELDEGGKLLELKG